MAITYNNSGMVPHFGNGGGGDGTGSPAPSSAISLPTNLLIAYSQTWVPPVDGNICIHVIGAGGSGAAGLNYHSLRCGAAGGYAKLNSLAVTTSDSFSITVGAGGKGVTADWYLAPNGYGIDGGSTTVSSSLLTSTITAMGGEGGRNNGEMAGGTASGGDINSTGGLGRYNYAGGLKLTGTTSYPESNGSDGRSEDCDIIGPESLMGHGFICGGLGGNHMQNSTSYDVSFAMPFARDGGFGAGGGIMKYVGASHIGNQFGGNGGIGGGGGLCGATQTSKAKSGDGGNGLVIIQYLSS